MFKNALRLAALALALVTMSNAVSFDAPVPTCGPCTGSGTFV
jgi:hypothetical protein